jgi:hypothetical protein
MMVLNALLLVYTGVIAPLQICLWTYDDPCNKFPTLFFDVFVDCFFLVRQPPGVAQRIRKGLKRAPVPAIFT